MKWNSMAFYLTIAFLSGCASPPPGPRVTVMPAPGKPIEQFAAEDRYCRYYAEQSVGISPSEAANRNLAGGAAAGTAIGALAGAAVGGHEGAGKGAAAGLVTGSVVGAQAGAYTSQEIQRRYDIAYEQCMYAKGNQLPSYGYGYRYQVQPSTTPAPYPPPPDYPPSPYPPPPPPR